MLFIENICLMDIYSLGIFFCMFVPVISAFVILLDCIHFYFENDFETFLAKFLSIVGIILFLVLATFVNVVDQIYVPFSVPEVQCLCDCCRK